VRILGSRVSRREDPALLTGAGNYVGDIRDALLEGAVHLTFVRSTFAHARLAGVDVDAARAMPGVVGVFTGADVDVGPVPPALPTFPAGMSQPLLAVDRVRYVGDPVVVVAAEHPAAGADAAEAVLVDYDPLPAVVDVEAASTDEILLHPGEGTNVATTYQVGADPDDDLFAGCDVVVSQRIVHARLAACPLEGRAAASAWADGRLHHWISAQAPNAVKMTLAAVFQLAPDRVHVIVPDVGGGFGPKFGSFAEDLTLAWVARRLGRPARWVETRGENMVGLPHGRGQVQHVTIGGSRDGTVRAYRLDVLQDAGAYPSLAAYTPSSTLRMTTGPYAIATASATARAVLTTTTPVSAYRGAGRPEAAGAMERAIELFAREIGCDPVEVRRRNLVPSDVFPYTTAVGTTYDTGDYERALDRVLEAARYDELRAEQARRRAIGDSRELGIGLALYVESTAGPLPGNEVASLEVDADGSMLVRTGTSPHGQGHDTSWSMIVSERLGVPMERVRVVHGDTDVVPFGMGTFGSRSLQLGGTAVLGAVELVADRARELAAELLEASPDDVVLDPSIARFHVAGTPSRAKTWSDVATAAVERGEPLAATYEFQASAPTYPFGAHVAVVEIDTETGAATLLRLVSVDDAGTVLNPVAVEGQRHGGIAQGVAQALLEEFRYDADGNPLTANLADYTMISAAELVSFELVDMETPTPVNPLGAKGIGEAGTIGAIPAVHNAVCDALAAYGIRHLDLPATPERVWRALGHTPGS
jgi:carbon-monoxide dehydrogenase large subunit